MTDIVITAAKRTAIGKFMGSLSHYSSPELGKLAIEAVLNAQKHEYLFMCAKVEIDEFNKYIYFPGLHSFSKSYKNHKKYAKDYHYALNKIRDNKIYKICYDDINNCFD